MTLCYVQGQHAHLFGHRTVVDLRGVRSDNVIAVIGPSEEVVSYESYERRSPDGDGLPMIKGLGDERASDLYARGGDVAMGFTPQQAEVHAPRGPIRNDEPLLKPAEGSEPSDARSIVSSPAGWEYRENPASPEGGAPGLFCAYCSQPIESGDADFCSAICAINAQNEGYD